MKDLPKTSRMRDLLFALLARTTARRERLPYRLYWEALYRRTRSWTKPVRTTIHNREVLIGFNYSYPITSRFFRTFNNPLVELVHEARLQAGRPVRLVDVGAAIGDTVLLIEANCPGAVSEYVCVDGDREFFQYLENNLSHLAHCRCLNQQLSRGQRLEKSLVRTHGGTASAQGSDLVAAQPLDDLLGSKGIGPIDVLKIDVDGFDGEVLAGATAILRRDRPAVIFEWHPTLCTQTGNDYLTHFHTLSEAGYTRFLWYDKFGKFHHFDSTPNDADLESQARFCLTTRQYSDWHYDVVALPPERPIDGLALAEMDYANRRPSPC